MPAAEPNVILRLGSHAEKDYFLKTVEHWDGLVVGANLLEAAPGATSSLILKFAGQKHSVPYYIDPMTYAFGTYVQDGVTRTDLDWIKSEQKVKGDSKKKVARLFKRSYRALAQKFGGAIEGAIQHAAGIDTLTPVEIKQLCQSLVEYQLTRVRDEFAADPEYKDIADHIPPPGAVLAPYFYIDPNNASRGLQLFLDCAATTAQTAGQTPTHAVLCTDVSTLSAPDFLKRAAELAKKSGVAAVWLWFSRFQEEAAELHQLSNFRSFVEDLRESVGVYNMHGGYFSLALSRFGLNGISHGVGYGEQKDVIPVIGQSTPTVRYYLPDVRRRLGVPQIERAFKSLGVETPNDFFDKVCGCSICRGVIKTSITQFASFGDLHYSSENSKRMAQTPAAAQRCRFHFLLNRIRERDVVHGQTAADIANDCRRAYNKWAKQPTVSSDASHLLRWETVFRV